MNIDRFKFRVWDKENESYQEEDAEWCFLRYDGFIDCGVSSDFDTIAEWHLKQENAVIEQCTGQKDQSGKLVYEGDICKDPIGNKFVVAWDDKNARFLGLTIPEKRIIYVGREPHVEVIGNIHEQDKGEE